MIIFVFFRFFLNNFGKFLVLGLIGFYQVIFSGDHGLLKVFFPAGRCRFYPSCSQYAREAVAKYGVFKGGLKAGRRIFRCHPFSSGGYDPLV